MESRATITGICPGCNHSIEVPGELEAFSCVYCGKRLCPAELKTAQAETLPDNQQLALYTHLCEKLPITITSELNVLKYMAKDAYPKHFSRYMEKYREIFAQIPRLRQDSIEKLASNTVSSIGRWAEGSHKGLVTKTGLLEEAKFTLCLLTIPTIRSLGHIACEDFARELQRAWSSAYPKSPFQLTTYEEIMSGFKPRKLCYITTATCRQAGKPDNCPELTAFRAFRDGYLANQPEGEALISRYYDIAPGIVMAINLCLDPDKAYPAIWQNYLRPCYVALQGGRNDLCQSLYTRMVEELPQKLLTGWSGQ